MSNPQPYDISFFAGNPNIQYRKANTYPAVGGFRIDAGTVLPTHPGTQHANTYPAVGGFCIDAGPVWPDHPGVQHANTGASRPSMNEHRNRSSAPKTRTPSSGTFQRYSSSSSSRPNTPRVPPPLLKDRRMLSSSRPNTPMSPPPRYSSFPETNYNRSLPSNAEKGDSGCGCSVM